MNDPIYTTTEKRPFLDPETLVASVQSERGGVSIVAGTSRPKGREGHEHEMGYDTIKIRAHNAASMHGKAQGQEDTSVHVATIQFAKNGAMVVKTSDSYVRINKDGLWEAVGYLSPAEREHERMENDVFAPKHADLSDTFTEEDRALLDDLFDGDKEKEAEFMREAEEARERGEIE